MDACVRWLQLPPSHALRPSTGLRWPTSRLGSQAHGLLDQQGRPVFILLGGQSSFTHQELWLGSIDPLALSVYEPNISSLALWGHSSCLKADPQQLWVFGGRGPHGALSNAMHCLSVWSPPQFVQVNSSTPAPLPRYRHAAAMDGNLMVMFGGVIHLGSTFKKKKYDDSVAVFDTHTHTWHYPAFASGPKPCSRCDHTLTRIREGVFLMMFGVLEDDDKQCNEVWELKSGAIWSWRRVQCTGAPLEAVSAHSAIFWNDCVVVFGGLKTARNGKNVSLCNHLSIVDTVTWQHHVIRSQDPPGGRCGHGCTLYHDIMVSLSYSVFRIVCC